MISNILTPTGETRLCKRRQLKTNCSNATIRCFVIWKPSSLKENKNNFIYGWSPITWVLFRFWLGKAKKSKLHGQVNLSSIRTDLSFIIIGSLLHLCCVCRQCVQLLIQITIDGFLKVWSEHILTLETVSTSVVMCWWCSLWPRISIISRLVIEPTLSNSDRLTTPSSVGSDFTCSSFL